jgi:hypothetical protein
MGLAAMTDEMVDHLDSNNLVPFKRRRNGYHLPGLQKEAEDQIIDEVDPELRPEEQSFVRHLLGYADILLNNASAREQPEDESLNESSNVTEIPRRDDEAA